MFPLLKQIDEQIEYDSIEWNRNAFQTLLVSIYRLRCVIFFMLNVDRHPILIDRRFVSMPSKWLFDISNVVLMIISGMKHLKH